MRKVQLLSLLATVGGCAVVASPAAAVDNVSTQVATLTAPQTMPILFAGTQSIYGKRVDQGAPIPKGSAVVQVTVEPLVGKPSPALFTAPCPEGSGALDFGAPAGVPLSGGFDAPIGEQVMQFRLFGPFTAAQGFSNVYMLCLPGVSNGATPLKSKVAPVAFKTVPGTRGVAKGAPLRPGQVVMRNSLVGLVQGEASFALTPCPKRYQPVLGASATPGVKGIQEGDVFQIRPPAKKITRATTYTLCQTQA